MQIGCVLEEVIGGKHAGTEKMEYRMFCQAVQMGNDVTICVWGGDTPHIGSTVVSTARPSLTGEGISVSSSVINGIGHKDEYIARKFAEAAAKQGTCTAVCTCGIHIDGISKVQIGQVAEAGERLLEKLLG